MSKEQVEAGGGGMLGRGEMPGWDEGSKRGGNLRVHVSPDGKSEDLGDSKDLRSRGGGIQCDGSSLGVPAGIQRLVGTAPVMGDGPDNPRTKRKER